MRTFLKNGTGLVRIDKWEPNCWINIETPNEKDRKYLLEELQISEAFYNDIADTDERPRIEIEDDWMLVIIRIPHKTDDTKLPYITIPVGFVFKDDIFVSICFHKTELISDFISYSKRKNITKNDHFDLVLKLLLSSSIWFLKYLKQINQHIKSAENKLEKSVRNEDLQRLFQIEKCLVYFTTSLKANDILLHKMKNLKAYSKSFDEELVEDVDIELRQALETTNIHSDILSGMMDAYASVVSNNLNVVMKQLTSISIILMIPTLIASFYGMNVPNSFQENYFGFWIILAISFFVSGLSGFIFLRKKWF